MRGVTPVGRYFRRNYKSYDHKNYTQVSRDPGLHADTFKITRCAFVIECQTIKIGVQGLFWPVIYWNHKMLDCALLFSPLLSFCSFLLFPALSFFSLPSPPPPSLPLCLTFEKSFVALEPILRVIWNFQRLQCCLFIFSQSELSCCIESATRMEKLQLQFFKVP